MTRKKVLFRADASEMIGAGHVMRCLTLADALRTLSFECAFVCTSLPENLARRIREAGHFLIALPGSAAAWEPHPLAPVEAVWPEEAQHEDAKLCLEAIENTGYDWVIVDHYGLDRAWHGRVRTRIPRVMVIDDLANRVHDCDLLLDQNLGRKPSDYEGLVSASAQILAGPAFALLRPQFAEACAVALERRKSPELSKLLVSVGGADPQNITGRLLRILNDMELPEKLRITVVIGALGRFTDDVRAIARAMRRPTEILVDVTDMARLMVDCDLAIGAAGATAWERCCLGLPSVVLVLADNQKPGAEALAAAGCALILIPQETDEFKAELAAAFSHLTSGGLAEQTRKIEKLGIDGQGCNRVVRALAAIGASDQCCLLRRAEEQDLDLLLAWRNNDAIRKSMLTQDIIALEDHRSWFEAASKRADRRLLMFIQRGEPAGFVNFKLDAGSQSATWGFYKEPTAPRGTGMQLGQAALRYAFEQLDLNKVWAEVLPSNEASHRMHLALGFRQEGRHREAYKVDGAYTDLVYYGLLRQDWVNLQG